MQPGLAMLLTSPSTAWAVTCTAGLTAGVILGCGITLGALANVALIAFVAVIACAKLLRALHAQRYVPTIPRTRASR